MNPDRCLSTEPQKRFPCTKRWFQSKQEAAQAAEAALGRERVAGPAKDGPIQTFFCERCRAWHFGHARTRR